MADGEGIEIYAVAGNNDFSSPICEHREAQIVYMRELIRMASDFGAPAVRAFFAWPGVTKHPQLASYTVAREHLGSLSSAANETATTGDRCRDALAECSRYAADYGVTLALQNHAPIVTSYKDVLRMIQQVNSPRLKACLDLPLLSDKSPEGIRAATSELGPFQALSHFGGEFDRNADGSVGDDKTTRAVRELRSRLEAGRLQRLLGLRIVPSLARRGRPDGRRRVRREERPIGRRIHARRAESRSELKDVASVEAKHVCSVLVRASEETPYGVTTNRPVGSQELWTTERRVFTGRRRKPTSPASSTSTAWASMRSTRASASSITCSPI